MTVKMDLKQLKRLKNGSVLTAAVAATVYSVVTGKGIFNKSRFREQHAELASYMDGNYPGCIYTPITIHGRGWSSSVIKRGRVISHIYFTKGDDGIYVFTESKVKFK